MLVPCRNCGSNGVICGRQLIETAGEKVADGAGTLNIESPAKSAPERSPKPQRFSAAAFASKRAKKESTPSAANQGSRI